MEEIRAVIEKFIKYPDNNNLTSLQNVLKSLDNSQIIKFQTYILLPLVVQVSENSKKKNTELNVKLVYCIKDLIKRIYINDLNAIKTILIVILQLIHNFDTGYLKNDTSEEIKLAAIECINETFQRSTLEVLQAFYKPKNYSFICKISITCVDIIQKEKYRKLRMAAIICLQSSFYVHDIADFDNISLRRKVADTVFSFLPKIASTLNNIATENEKHGHVLILLSIKTLGRILVLLFEDYIQNQPNVQYNQDDFNNLIKNSNVKNTISLSDDDTLGIKIKKNNSIEHFKNRQNEGRNEAWFKATSQKLNSILSRISVLRSNTSKDIRLEYAKFLSSLINCSKLLKENFTIFLESIIALSQDEDRNIQNICTITIKNMKDFNLDYNFNVELQTLFELHLTRLPRIICRSEESEQVVDFLFLKGFLNNMPSDIIQLILRVPENLDKFTKCLIAAYDLKLSKDLLQDEYALRNIEEDLGVGKFKRFAWKNFKNLSSNRAEKILNDICKILGRSSVIDLIFDQLIEAISLNYKINNECILILMLMLTDVSNNVISAKTLKLLQNYIEEILEEKHWHLALQPDEEKRLFVNKNSDYFVDRTPGLYESSIEIRISDLNIDEDPNDDLIKISDAQYNVLHTCLILEAIGNSALALKDLFKPFMFKSLHQILLKTGNSNYLVHKSGSFALNCLSKAMNYASIGNLIENYSDYISFHVNSSLKKSYNEESRSAVDILTLVLRYSSLSSISNLQNVIETILDQLPKTEQSSNITGYLKVFDMFLLSVDKWTKEKQNDLKIICNPEIEIKKIDIYDKCLEILNRPNEEIIINELENILDPEEDNRTQNFSEDKSKSNDPKYIEIVLKILKEVLKFIASKNMTQKIVSLECFINGLPILIDYETELLPLIHIMWYPFIERFKDDNPIVLSRCFALLEILAKCAKDFLLQRTLKDIIPFLNNFLEKSSVNSMRNINMTQTQEFMLQYKLLDKYGNLIIEMDIKHKPLDQVLDVVMLYINNKQPETLQQKAVNFFEILINYNRPLVYIKVMNLINVADFKENVNKILNFI